MSTRAQILFILLSQLLPGSLLAQPPADSSLFLYLPFHAGARDESVWRRPVIEHHATYGPDRFGQANGALYCNGSDAVLEIPPIPALNLPRSLTVSAWVKLDEAMATNELVLLEQRQGYQFDIRLAINGLGFTFYTTAETSSLSSTGHVIIPSPGFWYHCAVSWNGEGQEFTVFLNGKLVNKQSYPMQRLVIPNIPTSIGYSIGNDGLPLEIFKGWLDDVRLYNRVLRDAEMEALTAGYDFATEASTYQKTDHLEPGRYIIVPAVANKDSLVWPPRLVEVPAIEPVWKKSWFILLIAAAASAFSLLGAWFFYRQRQLEQSLEFEKIRALEAERFRIAREMHEDIGSGLSALNLLTDMALHKNLEPGLAAEMEHIAASSHKVSARIREIVWAIDLRHDSLEQLVIYFQQYATDFFHHAGVELNLTPLSRLPVTMLPGNTRRMVFLAFKEALHNILKHAHATRVDIDFTLAAKRLEIHIRDNGRGFDPATVGDCGNGLVNMRKRIEDIGGTFRIASGEKGTEVVFQVRL